MMKTIIDQSVLTKVRESEPLSIKEGGSLNENKKWYSFWDFLTSGSDLEIINFNDDTSLNYDQEIFLTGLTEGRGDSKISIVKDFKTPINFVFPSNTFPASFFCLKDSENSKFYREGNGYFFGFENDVFQQWEKLSLFNLPHLLPVRENHSGKKLNSWDEIQKYLLPFTDVIICDNYIFDKQKMNQNLGKVIKILNSRTPVDYNLLIISFEKHVRNQRKDEKERKELLLIEELGSDVMKMLVKSSFKFNFGIVLAPYELKQHDRGIFMNYMRIYSGDSFNYFNESGDYNTRGTDIFFLPQTNPDNFNSYIAAVKNFKDLIKNIEEGLNPKEFLLGNLENRLFDM